MAGKKKNTFIKSYIQLLADNPDPKLTQLLLKTAPDDVIKTICNAAYNLTNGSVPLSKSRKTFFRKYKLPITILVQPNRDIRQKKRVLVQKGGGYFVPLLLSTVLPLITSLLQRR